MHLTSQRLELQVNHNNQFLLIIIVIFLFIDLCRESHPLFPGVRQEQGLNDGRTSLACSLQRGKQRPKTETMNPPQRPGFIAHSPYLNSMSLIDCPSSTHCIYDPTALQACLF